MGDGQPVVPPAVQQESIDRLAKAASAVLSKPKSAKAVEKKTEKWWGQERWKAEHEGDTSGFSKWWNKKNKSESADEAKARRAVSFFLSNIRRMVL